MTNITISKGSITVTLQTTEINEDYGNSFRLIPMAQPSQNQTGGPKDQLVSDLLKITNTYQIRGHLTKTDTKTAKEIKDELKSIFNGANIAGGAATIVYDGDTLEGFLQKLLITKDAAQANAPDQSGVVRYNVQITFVEGKAVGA